MTSTSRETTPVSASPAGEPGPDTAVLEAVGIAKSFRRGLVPRHSFPVIVDAGLSLGLGEVVGLVGENGSGKTTLMRILVGDLAPDAGTVTRRGVIGYCPQQPLVYPRLTCDEHFDLFAAAYGMSRHAPTAAHRRAAARRRGTGAGRRRSSPRGARDEDRSR